MVLVLLVFEVFKRPICTLLRLILSVYSRVYVRDFCRVKRRSSGFHAAPTFYAIEVMLHLSIVAKCYSRLSTPVSVSI